MVALAGYLGASYSKESVQLFELSMLQWITPIHNVAEQLYGIHLVFF